MPSVYEIPLSGTPQRFNMQLGAVNYQFMFIYRDAPPECAGGGGWVMDINDALGGRIACGIPLVTGHDLLEQFAYLGFTGQMRVRSDGVPEAVPTFDNLGSGSHLYWITLP